MQTQLSPALKTALMLAAIVIILAGVKTASPIIVPFILSIFIAIICNPALKILTAKGLPKGLAITLIITVVLMSGLWLANLVGKAVNDFSTQLPMYQEQLTQRFGGLWAQLQHYNFPVELHQLTDYFDPSAAMNVVTVIVGGFGGVMANLFLIILTVIFILAEACVIPKKLHVAFDDPNMRMAQIDEFLAAVNQYLAIKTVVSMLTGIIISLVLWAIGLDYWVLWGVLAFLLNYIPNIGTLKLNLRSTPSSLYA